MGEGKPTYDELVELVQQLRRRIAELEDQLREAHRQAAPFERRKALRKPPQEKKSPGRQPGHPGQYRMRPEQIDREEEVPLAACPNCGGDVSGLTRCEQVIEELPRVEPMRIKLTTWQGTCARCGEVRSTHPLQTSTATGAAGTHLGPQALATCISLVHRSGLTMGRACGVLKDLFGLSLSRGGLAQILQRAASRVEPWFEQIREEIRSSKAVNADETSWYVGERGWWLWVYCTSQAALYRVERSRGSEVVRETLTDEFRGMLVSDCLASYNPIDCLKHKCIAHHLRALKEHEQSLAQRGITSSYLQLWKLHLQDVIATWSRRSAVSAEDYAAKVLQLTRGVENLLERAPPEPEDVAFRDRLARQREHLLGCLSEPAAEPTNNRAERDLRPAVISRKLSCGNRTIAGKRAWETLRSVAVTAQKQGDNLLAALTARLRLTAQ
jgi:transposase